MHTLLGNKIDFIKSVQIYTKSATIAKTTKYFDKERLRMHLAGYSLQYFTESEFDSYYKFLSALYKSESSISVSKSSSDFYDKLFDEILRTGNFSYPNSNENSNKTYFIAFSDGTAWANKNKEESQIAIYVYNWLLYVAKKNTALHKHIIALMDDEKIFTESEKISYLNSVIRNISFEQIFSDPNAVNQIFIRARAYRNAIYRLTECILSFYTEHEDEIDYYVAKANDDYLPTPEIIQVDGLNIFDIDKISLRDMLSGKELK